MDARPLVAGSSTAMRRSPVAEMRSSTVAKLEPEAGRQRVTTRPSSEAVVFASASIAANVRARETTLASRWPEPAGLGAVGWSPLMARDMRDVRLARDWLPRACRCTSIAAIPRRVASTRTAASSAEAGGAMAIEFAVMVVTRALFFRRLHQRGGNRLMEGVNVMTAPVLGGGCWL